MSFARFLTIVGQKTLPSTLFPLGLSMEKESHQHQKLHHATHKGSTQSQSFVQKILLGLLHRPQG